MMAPRPCDTCKQVYKPRRRDHRFCSAQCRLAAFLQRRTQTQRKRDAKVRLLLKEALGLLEHCEDGTISNRI